MRSYYILVLNYIVFFTTSEEHTQGQQQEIYKIECKAVYS